MRLFPTPLLLAAALALGACRTAGPSRGPAVVPDSARLIGDVAYLASDALEGRATGAAGSDSAAAWIARRFAALGLRPLGSGGGYFQPFVARSAQLAHLGLPWELPTRNVVALIPGTDPVRAHQYLVIGAHYDHVGRGGPNAADPEAEGRIHPGADDNASGTAAVLELARLLRARPLSRPVLVVAFGAEELGLLGSQWFVAHPPVPLDSADAMLNFDMVGRLRGGKLLVSGVATAGELRTVLERANAAAGAPLQLSELPDGFGPSDHSSFYARGIPVLHFFTDVHPDYHRATDVASRIDAGGEARVVALAERVVRAIDQLPAPLHPVTLPAPAASTGPRQGSDVYFGSVPDMAAGDGRGIRLTGVRPGSPADQAGVHEGDVIVELGGHPVTDLYSYSDALYSHHPGDAVTVVLLRGTQRLTLQATLGRRTD